MTTSLSVFLGKNKTQAFFFRGDQYVRFDKRTGKVDDNYPKQIKGKWPGLTFDRIDAVVNWGNGDAYFFSGSQYIRYNLRKDQAYEDYPRSIQEFWRGVTFDSVDAVANWGEKAYFFKGDQYIRYDIATDRADPGYPKPIKGIWPGMNFDSVDTVINWGDGFAYFFKDDQYYPYDIKNDRAENLPLQFALPWPAVPFASVDAVANWGTGFAYFFKGDQYARFEISKNWGSSGYPLKIKGQWSGMDFESVDAVTNWGNGKAYFFKGDRYVRFDIATDQVDPGFPLKIKNNWPGITFDSVDAVVNWGNGKAYFFKDKEYIRYDVANEAADPGYPLKINGNWPGLDFDRVDAVVNWDGSDAYFFKGGEYQRYLIKENRAADGRRPVNAMTWSGLAWGKKQYNWMGSIPGIEAKKLAELTLPATHDSAAYDFIPEISPVNDLPRALTDGMQFAKDLQQKAIWQTFIELNRDMSRTHNRSVGEQLAYGIRSLDLRVCSYKGKLHTYHGLVGMPVSNILDQIKEFLVTAEREVVLVTASHMKNLSFKDHQTFFSVIKEKLADYLYPYDTSRRLGDITLGEIVRGPSGNTSRIVFFYDPSSSQDDKNNPLVLPSWVWPYEGVFSKYSDDSNLARMGADQQQKLVQNSGTPQQMFELCWTLTPENDELLGEGVARFRALSARSPTLTGIIDTVLNIMGASYKEPAWHTLEELTRRPNATLWDFVARHSDKKINSLSVDFFQDARAVELAIEMCRQVCVPQKSTVAVAAAINHLESLRS